MPTLVPDRCVAVSPPPAGPARPSTSDVLELARAVGPYLGWCPAAIAAALRRSGASLTPTRDASRAAASG